MTRKDYIAIAAMFAKTLADVNEVNDSQTRAAARVALHRLARRFCYHAIDDNSRFDESRFMAACKWEVT